MLKIDPKIFAENLLLTQIYCEEQLKNTHKSDAEILRSFNPIKNGIPVVSFLPGPHSWVNWSIDPFENSVYEYLFEEQLENKKDSVNLYEASFKGEILIVEIDNSFFDGASESCSEGFIDGHDCPPIDTWFYLTRANAGRILYAWIPDRFVNLVQNGYDVNVLATFEWENDWVDASPKEPVRKVYSKPDFSLKQPISNKYYWLRIGIIVLLWLILYVFRKY